MYVHCVSNLFLLTLGGQICATYLNSPGTTHDSTIANISKIYGHTDEVYHRNISVNHAKVVVVQLCFRWLNIFN